MHGVYGGLLETNAPHTMSFPQNMRSSRIFSLNTMSLSSHSTWVKFSLMALHARRFRAMYTSVPAAISTRYAILRRASSSVSFTRLFMKSACT